MVRPPVHHVTTSRRLGSGAAELQRLGLVDELTNTAEETKTRAVAFAFCYAARYSQHLLPATQHLLSATQYLLPATQYVLCYLLLNTCCIYSPRIA